MTAPDQQTPAQADLPIDWREMARFRVRPAEFARMLGVSKQAVSQWIRDGKVTLGADGRLEPAAATRQVINNSDPTRLRARVLTAAVADSGTQRRRIGELESKLAAAHARISFLEDFSEGLVREEEHLEQLLEQHAVDLFGAMSTDDLLEKINVLRGLAEERAANHQPASADPLDELEEAFARLEATGGAGQNQPPGENHDE